MTSRQEVIAEPLTVYFRPFSGSKPAFPGVDATAAAVVAAGWTAMGRHSRNSIKREGVKVSTSPEFAEFLAANDIKISDRWITKEDAEVSFSVVDLSLEIAAFILDQTVTTTAGTPDHKDIGFGRPLDVARHSILLRGRTPYNDRAENDKWRQFLLWDCIVTSGLDEQSNRDTPGEYPIMLRPIALATEDEVYKYGRIRAWSGA